MPEGKTHMPPVEELKELFTKLFLNEGTIHHTHTHLRGSYDCVISSDIEQVSLFLMKRDDDRR